MAHWNHLDQSAGFQYSALTGDLSFDPRFSVDQFSVFVVLQNGWGEYTQTTDALKDTTTATLASAYGTMSIKTLTVQSLVVAGRNATTAATASVDGKAVAGTWDPTTAKFTFTTELSLATGQKLSLAVAPSAGVICVDMEGSGKGAPSQVRHRAQKTEARLVEAARVAAAPATVVTRRPSVCRRAGTGILLMVLFAAWFVTGIYFALNHEREVRHFLGMEMPHHQ